MFIHSDSTELTYFNQKSQIETAICDSLDLFGYRKFNLNSFTNGEPVDIYDFFSQHFLIDDWKRLPLRLYQYMPKASSKNSTCNAYVLGIENIHLIAEITEQIIYGLSYRQPLIMSFNDSKIFDWFVKLSDIDLVDTRPLKNKLKLINSPIKSTLIETITSFGININRANTLASFLLIKNPADLLDLMPKHDLDETTRLHLGSIETLYLRFFSYPAYNNFTLEYNSFLFNDRADGFHFKIHTKDHLNLIYGYQKNPTSYPHISSILTYTYDIDAMMSAYKNETVDMEFNRKRIFLVSEPPYEGFALDIARKLRYAEYEVLNNYTGIPTGNIVSIAKAFSCNYYAKIADPVFDTGYIEITHITSGKKSKLII